VKISPPFVDAAIGLHLPVKGLIRATIFKHFCGGETIEECAKTTEELGKYNIGTILDYSVEGKETEKDFEHSLQQTLACIEQAKGNKHIPFSVFKLTGFARFALLEKVNAKLSLTENEKEEFDRVKQKVQNIFDAGTRNNVPVLIDAEESWIQIVTDELAEEMMMKYNKERVMIYNTVQMYRTDRLEFIKTSLQHAQQNNYKLGLKIVRGAYMEKERKRAKEMNYTSPIHQNKISVDNDYDAALRFCINHIDTVSICAGTHNENSSMLLAELMNKKNIAHNNPHIWFSQLYGMSDHISFNLSQLGYNVCKYVPYGPVTSVLPYLIRRAQENTSVKGQTGRELSLILQEKKRRPKI
jgi:proline dehydrogenase